MKFCKITKAILRKEQDGIYHITWLKLLLDSSNQNGLVLDKEILRPVKSSEINFQIYCELIHDKGGAEYKKWSHERL